MSLFCTRDYNPFTDPNNSNAHVMSWTFSGRDSVAIYETGTFTVAIAVREEMDSVRIISTKNRFWTDTTIGKTGPDGMMNREYSFKVSFFDTGDAKLTIESYRSNGLVVKQESTFRVFNPLLQTNVFGFFGDTVNLLTMDVADRNVLYHWKLGNFWSGYSVSSQLSDVIPLIYPNYGDGKLWVTDLEQKFPSPSVRFAFTLKDTLEPEITCINAGLHGDTIVSSDTLFPFRVVIFDKACAVVESCSVNGTIFDFFNGSTNVYTKLFRDLPKLAMNSQNKLLTLNVFALDNVDFRNVSRRTFYVRFDPSGQPAENVAVSFDRPDRDTLVTGPAIRSYRIHGTVQSIRNEALTLVCLANGTNVGSPFPVTGTGEWSWVVPLAEPFTTVNVTAYDVEGRVRASGGRVIVYKADAVDIVKPVIWQIACGSEVIGSEFVTKEDKCELKVTAFDDGVGLAYLVIDHDTLPADTLFTWYKNIDGLTHSVSGKIVQVVAVDKKNNRQERTVKIFRNSIPVVTEDPISDVELCAGEKKDWQIVWEDAEGDDIGENIIKKPSTMSITGVRTPNTRLISWQPMVRPGTDRDTLIIELGDAYAKKNRYFWEFVIKNCGQSAAKIKFTTPVDDFPGVLQADIDRMDVLLTVDSVPTSSPLRYTARLIDRNITLLDNSTLPRVQWAPTLADTGYGRLMITVGDSATVFDTLLPAIRVVPKNQYPCSLSVRFSGVKTFAGLDLFTHPEPETLYFTINDKDPPIAESYIVNIAIGALHSEQTLNQRDFKLVVKRNALKLADTLVAMVSDRNNTSDTLQQIILYFPPSANIPPDTVNGPGFPPLFCVGKAYPEYQIKVADFNNEPVEVRLVHAPPGMTVTATGLVRWASLPTDTGDDGLIVRLYDKIDSSGLFSWPVSVVDCDAMPPAVSFVTTEADFPLRLQAGADMLQLQLKITSGGAPPFSYEGYIDGRRILDNGTGEFVWQPIDADAGERTIIVTVADRYGRKDTIAPAITILPKNQFPCELSFEYSGPVLPSKMLTLFSIAQPESALFTILDEDHPATERYTVKVNRRGSLFASYNLQGNQRSFSVRVANPTYATVTTDTFVVFVKDTAGFADTSRFVVRYPVGDPTDITPISLSLDASEGVSTQMGGGRVNRWTETSGGYTITQQETGRQPVLTQKFVNTLPAILFDHVADNGDDGLFAADFGEWAASPFTVFVVFSARSHTASTRLALVTTNVPDGFGLGIGCDQTISIFNDINTQGCTAQDSASSGLKVALNTWYVASFKSGVGINVRGEIQVMAWLNGVEAPHSMVMSTQSGSGLMVGTGSSGSSGYGRPGGGSYNGSSGGYNGSFDGYIASVVIYQRALSDDERDLIEYYLGSRYGIATK